MNLKVFLSWFYLGFFGIGLSIGFIRQDDFEMIELKNALAPMYDALGRNCIQLTLSAMSLSFIRTIPIGVLCISTSFFLAFLFFLISGRSKNFALTTMDLFSSLPGYLIALSLSVFFLHSNGVTILCSLLIVTPALVRFLESQISQLFIEPHIQSALALGASRSHVIRHHLFPVLIRLLASILPFVWIRLLLVETSLTFLGIGYKPEHETWGSLILQGKEYFIEAPWIFACAAAPLFFTLLVFHLLSSQDRH